MFTASDRERIRGELIGLARAHPAIVGAALVGSAARGREDAWSDIDLALQLASDADEPEVVDQWSVWIDEQFGVADSFDVFGPGHVRYRVFLLTSSLQIDVSFWPQDQFRATDEGFQLIFGASGTPTTAKGPDLGEVIGLGWLDALHARSALGRGRLWQATMMLDELRSQVITLMCLRNGLNPWHGREVDRLPAPERAALAGSRAGSVSGEALAESQRLLVTLLLDEIERHDVERAASLRTALTAIAGSGDLTEG